MRRRILQIGCAVLAGVPPACAERVPAPDTGDGADSIRGVAPADYSGLRLEADVAVLDSVPVQLKGSLEVTNPTDQPTSFDVGGCSVFMRIYDSTGAEVWDQGRVAVCTMILQTVTLEPGETERFQTAEAPAPDFVPAGTYRVAVYLALVEGGQPEAPAGEVELGR